MGKFRCKSKQRKAGRRFRGTTYQFFGTKNGDLKTSAINCSIMGSHKQERGNRGRDQGVQLNDSFRGFMRKKKNGGW